MLICHRLKYQQVRSSSDFLRRLHPVLIIDNVGKGLRLGIGSLAFSGGQGLSTRAAAGRYSYPNYGYDYHSATGRVPALLRLPKIRYGYLTKSSDPPIRGAT
eukprot:scaffold97384_cov40-Prasinocladus_malaysianus.AAC.1